MDSGDLRRKLEKFIINDLKTRIRKLENLHCSEHGSAPEIIYEGNTFQTFNAEISGDLCCDKFKELVESKFNEIFKEVK